MTCACGQPLHYTDPQIQVAIEALVSMNGEYVKVTRTEDNRAWMVQRHYIALHGIRAKDLGTPALPAFEEVKP